MWPTSARRKNTEYSLECALMTELSTTAKWRLEKPGGVARVGSYLASFSADQSGTTIIRVQVSDNISFPPHQLSWSISSPKSLWYPGTHSGTMILPRDFPSFPPDIYISTQIFSPHVGFQGVMRPGITVGDTWRSNVTILDILHDIAAMLVVSPVCRWDTILYRLPPRLRPHTVLNQLVMTFFNKDEEAFLRATNFFSRALAQDGDVQEVNREVTPGDVEGTVLTITELMDHFEYRCSRVSPFSYVRRHLRPTFEGVKELQEFRRTEHRWASTLISMCN